MNLGRSQPLPVGFEGGAVKAMIPFTSSMLLGCRPGRYPVQSFVIIEPPGLTFKHQENSTDGINISIPGTTMAPEEDHGTKDISDAEWILLETIDCRSNRPLHTGPFLTVQRRRRRRKYVRTYLFKDPTLIDDLSAYQTNFVLDRISNWEFNAFILDNVTGGRPLPNLCVHLFKMYGLLEHFNLDPVTVWKVFSIIEDGYHWRNPYHNAVHAADVTQAMHCFLQEKMILEKLTKVEILSALLAAVTHDLDHPGVNQPFLVATSNHLAALYKNSSVLENHHWRSAMGCLHESGMSEVLGPELVETIEWQIRSLVLATDITRQREFLDKLKEYMDTNTLDMDDPDVRHFVLQIALKCADICNPCRPWEISRKWSMKVCEEFFRQGDYERQLNLPVTSLCDRYSTSVPKIQTGFLQYVVQPLFKEWHRMMNTPLSIVMKENLEFNNKKWEQLLADEEAQETQTETSDAEDTEIPKHSLEESGQISVRVASIKTGGRRGKDESQGGMTSSGRSVRFDIDTTVTEASDSEASDNGCEEERDQLKIRSELVHNVESEFLGIPRPDGRRHSIATGLMGIQVPPAQLLSTMGGLGSPGMSSSSLNVSEVVTSSRMVGRTVIRRESLPSGNLLPGRALPSKTILHLQRLSAKAESERTAASSQSPRAESASPPDLPVSPGRLTHGEKSSCSSTSTVDEILDFTYSLPEHGSRSSTSPRRSTLEATDLDELCPPTSILSMSPSVAHVSLQQSIEIDEQRRHLIRQQTCPVVSVHEGGGSFNRPRFLSAAAAISPTAVASSSIISQHRIKNRSPETGEESGPPGRMSGGSSNEGLMQCCEVISEEVDRGSGGSSTEASPLEIFVQQFPPVPDDNDGEAPRRGSGSCNMDSENNESNLSQCNNQFESSFDPISGEAGDPISKCRSKDSLLGFGEDCDFDDSPSSPVQMKQGCDFYRSERTGNGEERESFEDYGDISLGKETQQQHPSDSGDRRSEESAVGDCWESVKLGNKGSLCGGGKSPPPPPPVETNDSSTQTDSTVEKENFDPSCIISPDEEHPFSCSSPAGKGISHTGSNTVSTSTATSNNRLATLMMWRNNRVWKSLTEEEGPEESSNYLDDDHLPKFCERWDVRFSQQTHQGVVGARLQIRRGSAPTNGPSLGCRGAQDRRSDPTHYHSDYRYDAVNPSTSSVQGQLRRGSIPVDLLRQASILRPVQQPKKAAPTRRRGSLPTDTIASDHGSIAYKWMPMLPYSEDDIAIAMKRRSSGGPELFAAAQSKSSLPQSVFLEHLGACGIATESPGIYWPGRRRGSLPVEVCIASSVSCSSESESSAGDSSDT